MADLERILVNYWKEDYKNGGSFIIEGAKTFPQIDEILLNKVPDYHFADYWNLKQYPEMEDSTLEIIPQ